MFKKNLFSIFVLMIATNSFSQEIERGRFDWNKVFAGGNIVLGYGAGNNSSQFTIGAYPEIGYSIFKSVDVGLGFNVISQSGSEFNVDYSLFNFGMGIFTRIHITDGFFVQAQPEFNNIKFKIPSQNFNENFKSTSTLVGVGWGEHEVGQMNFFTLILIDLNNNIYSPYRSQRGEIIPQFRIGYNWYFNRKKKR